MQCLHCGNKKFLEQKRRFTPEIKDERVEVIVSCFICGKCKEPLMNAQQMNQLRKAAADKYKETHGLLTSSQIIAYREELGMSQAAFARYLNVGEASLKRWETYYIQDASQDELIRLKCDFATAEMNFLNINWKRSEPDEFNGNRKFNFQLFKQVVLFVVKKTNPSPLFLNKILYYIDNLNCKNYGASITGARYIPLKYGPCPDQYSVLYDTLVKRGFIKEGKNHILEALQEPDMTVFDDNEKATLETIVSYCKKYGIKNLYKLAHEEKGFIETGECSFISYKYAKNLLLDTKNLSQ